MGSSFLFSGILHHIEVCKIIPEAYLAVFMQHKKPWHIAGGVVLYWISIKIEISTLVLDLKHNKVLFDLHGSVKDNLQ